MMVLLRHGKTLANERKLYAGALDEPLSALGRAELAGYEARGLYPAGAAFFTSGMLRCEQTLDALYGPVERERISALSEYRFGHFEGKSYEELKEEPAYQAWITDEAGDTPCPDGESRNGFRARVLAGFERLSPWLAREDLAIAVLHGGVIATLMEQLFPGERHFYAWQPPAGLGWTVTAGRYTALVGW